MGDTRNRKMTSLRLPPELLDWFTTYAKSQRLSKTQVVEELLWALREGRMTIRPRSGPNAFPAEEVAVGSTPECPALIAYHGVDDA
jgi:hypothetical protein